MFLIIKTNFCIGDIIFNKIVVFTILTNTLYFKNQ